MEETPENNFCWKEIPSKTSGGVIDFLHGDEIAETDIPPDLNMRACGIFRFEIRSEVYW
jgi:hypothetical protein